MVATETTATDEADGTPLYTNYSSAFIRGEGGWGGDRGPSGPRNVPPEREPDHEITYQTSPDQALVYRLSGDRNPLHSDPSFAAMGGFDRPILHGLCTYGFTGRALLHALCGSDPARFQHVEGRFSSPVLPGDALSIKMWETGAGRGGLHDVEAGRHRRDRPGRPALLGLTGPQPSPPPSQRWAGSRLHVTAKSPIARNRRPQNRRSSSARRPRSSS